MSTGEQEAIGFTFPEELRKAVEGLDSPIRWQIMESLINNGKSSHTGLMTAIGLDNTGQLNPHLKILLQTGLLDRTEAFGSRGRERSFYDISAFGKNMINGLLSALVPPEPKSVYEGLQIQVPVYANLWGSVELTDPMLSTGIAAAAVTINTKRTVQKVQ